MKFIHLADLHLGKIIYQRNLLDIQEDLLQQVVDYMNQQDIHTLVIAGDVYDRAIASKESVLVLNDFLDVLINQNHKKILMISGNHDSSERLQFASSLLKRQGLYIVTYPDKELKPIEIEGVNFYLVPFFKPSYIQCLFEQEDLKTYQDAFEYYMSKQTFDHSRPCVLVTHQFVAGNKNVIRSESEVILTVGGTEIIDVDLMKDFDYVALGHLHASQKIKYDYVRYAGSLMKYSFDEVNQVKGMVEVTIDENGTNINTIPLKPKKDLVKIKGLYHDVLNFPDNKTDFVCVELQDEHLVGHAGDLLREKYPDLLQVTFPQSKLAESSLKTTASQDFEKLTPLELFEEFYEKMIDEKPDEEDLKIIQDLMEGDEDNDAA